MRRVGLIFGGIVAAVTLSGCVIAPRESRVEKRRVAEAGQVYEAPRERRTVPELPANPSADDVLRRAFLASGTLEAAYHEWAMAVARIDQAGTFPTEDLNLGFDYMFSGGRMRAFDRTTMSAGLMNPSRLPNQVYQNATVAWREAQAAGERFRGAKFELQAKVLAGWADYALQAERVRLRERDVTLLRLVSQSAATRVRAGAPQEDQLRADVQLRTAENELATARAELVRQRAGLNAMLVRPADAALEPPAAMPEPRALGGSDEEVLAAGVRNNPELAALGKDVEAREAAIRRARMEYWPGFTPTVAFTGGVSQAIGGMVSVPTQVPKIRAMVAEARSDLARTRAELAQARADRASEFVGTLVALRDFERRSAVFDKEILPLSERTLDLTRQRYAAGAAAFTDLIEAQRTVLDVRLMSAEARAARERMLAELERLAGADAGRLVTRAATRPSGGVEQ